MKQTISLICVGLLVLVALPGRSSAQSAAAPSGHWEGAIAVPEGPLAIVVDLASKNAGAWEGTITIPAQGVKSFPLSRITSKDGAVGFVMQGIPGDPTFKGTLSKDGRSIAGDYTQGPAALTFTLAWKGDAVIERAARSTPITADLAGTWEGALDVNGATLRLVATLVNHADGATGTLVSLDQGAVEIPIATIVQAAAHVTLTLTAINAVFEGDLKDGQLTGTWKQGPGSLPLVLKRKS